MRSGSTGCSALCSVSRPCTQSVALPTPSIRAPILIRQWARSTTSGSRAAFSIKLSPRASTAAIRALCVAPTETLESAKRSPVRPPRRAGDDIAALELDLGAERLERLRCRSTGRVPMAQPPGSETFALPQRASSGAEHPEAGPHARHHLVRRGGVDDLAARST